MSNISFNVGEIIWAKIRGYSWWPAIITGVEDDNREKKYGVVFIGDNTHSSLAKKCLEKFEKGLKLYSNTKKKNLQEVIEKAKEIYYNKNGIKDKEIKSMMKKDAKLKEKEKDVKSNIVKEINDKFYKIYSEGDPELIKTMCKKETIPENYDEIISKNNKEGNEIMSLCGKKVKMNYLQCQRIERNKCESNMIFLGFVYYKKAHFGEYNPGIS